MKKLFATYRPVLVFIGLFFSAYLLLSLIYGAYLNLYSGSSNVADPITNLVAAQSTQLIESFEFKAQVIPATYAPHMKLIIDGRHTANIIEGCNAVSIIILFMAFVIAFVQGFKKTFFFILAGVTLIYAVNIIRISVLAIALYKYPEQGNLLHSVVFPGIIYGMVLVLWVLWVRILKGKTL